MASVGDLAGEKVCVTQGSDSGGNLSLPSGETQPIVVSVPYWTDCLVLLQQGQVAAISTDDSILDGLEAQDPFTKIVGPPLNDQPYGLAISKQHPDFVRFVNAVLAQERADGAWAARYAYWVGTPVPKPPAAQYAGLPDAARRKVNIHHPERTRLSPQRPPNPDRLDDAPEASLAQDGRSATEG